MNKNNKVKKIYKLLILIIYKNKKILNLKLLKKIHKVNIN
jgi:hypothetical protein